MILPKLDFKKLYTTQLLVLLRDSYPYLAEKCECCNERNCFFQKQELFKWQNAIKKELATREHVPNKKESKELRKLRKKSGISRKKK
jgi:hypothetical protein